MRREAAFRCRVVGELHRQLEYASIDARLRLLDAAETLIREIDLDRGYPVEFVTYRLTAWKPEPSTVVETVAGEALLADLVTMIQRLSRRCALPMDEDDCELLDGTAEALGVSRRTLVRLRRRGLAMRYAQCSDGHLRLACRHASLEWFRNRWPDLIDTTVRSSRQRTPPTALLDAAKTLPEAASVQAMAKTLARQFPDRTAASIRSLLRRASARGELVLPVQGRLSDRDKRFAQRATRRCVPPARIAAHLHIGVPSLHRAMLRLRMQRVMELHAALPPPPPEVSRREKGVPPERREDERDASALSAACVGAGLGSWDAHLSLSGSVAEVDAPAAFLLAMHVLRRRFGVMAAGGAAQPSAGQLDRAETDLRWMCQLRWALLAHLTPVLRRTVEQWCGRPPSELPAQTQRVVLRRGLEALRGVIIHQPASEADRLAARGRSAIDRCLAEIVPPRADLAFPRLSEPPALSLRRSEPSQDLLPEASWESRLPGLPALHKELSILRWGLGGRRPWTLQEVADRRGCSTSALARAWAAAQRSLVRPKHRS